MYQFSSHENKASKSLNGFEPLPSDSFSTLHEKKIDILSWAAQAVSCYFGVRLINAIS